MSTSTAQPQGGPSTSFRLASPASPNQPASPTRRPMSPSQLRELDLRPRDSTFPTPPTGHELMAMFPAPAPPALAPNTSNYFEKQERDFFAQAGREIIRVGVTVRVDERDGEASRGGVPRSWPPASGSPPPMLPPQPPHHHHHHHAHHHHQHQHSSPQYQGSGSDFERDRESRERDRDMEREYTDGDESWKRPIPYAERRRAGKHTRRVVVRT